MYCDAKHFNLHEGELIMPKLSVIRYLVIIVLALIPIIVAILQRVFEKRINDKIPEEAVENGKVKPSKWLIIPCLGGSVIGIAGLVAGYFSDGRSSVYFFIFAGLLLAFFAVFAWIILVRSPWFVLYDEEEFTYRTFFNKKITARYTDIKKVKDMKGGVLKIYTDKFSMRISGTFDLGAIEFFHTLYPKAVNAEFLWHPKNGQ